MTDINWTMLRPAENAGDAFQRRQQQGRAIAERNALQTALAAHARHPTDGDALATITALSPATAISLRAASREQSVFDRGERFRDALSGFQTGSIPPLTSAGPSYQAQPNALGAVAGDVDAPGALTSQNPLDPRPAFHPKSSMRSEPVGSVPVDPGPGGGTLDALASDVLVTGRRPTPAAPPPRAPGGAGWDAVVRADPVAALAAGQSIFGARKSRWEDTLRVNEAAGRLLGGVHDQDSWDRAKVTAHHIYESYGVPYPDNLPDEYSPEAVHDIQLQQLDATHQLKAHLEEGKLAWDQEDDRLDNARDDRNVDSQMHDRDARRGLTVRGQNMADARGRYGIGVASADRRRGQNVTAATVRRGQDLRPARTGGSRAGGLPAGILKVAVGPDGHKVGWNGRAWVDVK